jgi:hypothetical protein
VRTFHKEGRNIVLYWSNYECNLGSARRHFVSTAAAPHCYVACTSHGRFASSPYSTISPMTPSSSAPIKNGIADSETTATNIQVGSVSHTPIPSQSPPPSPASQFQHAHPLSRYPHHWAECYSLQVAVDRERPWAIIPFARRAMYLRHESMDDWMNMKHALNNFLWVTSPPVMGGNSSEFWAHVNDMYWMVYAALYPGFTLLDDMHDHSCAAPFGKFLTHWMINGGRISFLADPASGRQKLAKELRLLLFEFDAPVNSLEVKQMVFMHVSAYHALS